MKRLLFLFAGLIALPCALSFTPPSQDEHSGDEKGEHAAKPEASLHDEMEALEKSFKALRRSIRDEAQVAASLQNICDLQAAVLKCKLLQPPMIAGVPAEEQAAFIIAYRKEMLTLLKASIEMEEALLDGRHDETRAIYKKIHDTEESGHEKFVEDE